MQRMAGGTWAEDGVQSLETWSGCAVTLKAPVTKGPTDTWVQSSEKKKDQGQQQGFPCLLVFHGRGAFLQTGRPSEAQVWGCYVYSGKVMPRGPGQSRGHI